MLQGVSWWFITHRIHWVTESPISFFNNIHSVWGGRRRDHPLPWNSDNHRREKDGVGVKKDVCVFIHFYMASQSIFLSKVMPISVTLHLFQSATFCMAALKHGDSNINLTLLLTPARKVHDNIIKRCVGGELFIAMSLQAHTILEWPGYHGTCNSWLHTTLPKLWFLGFLCRCTPGQLSYYHENTVKKWTFKYRRYEAHGNISYKKRKPGVIQAIISSEKVIIGDHYITITHNSAWDLWRQGEVWLYDVTGGERKACGIAIVWCVSSYGGGKFHIITPRR